MLGLVCCFFGYRNTMLTDEEIKKLKALIEDLIVNHNVVCFLFGSRSDFDFICHKIVTELKAKYPHIVRKKCTCRSEACTLESERKHWEEVYSYFEKQPVTLLGVEEEVEHKTKYISGKAGYIERNQAMINDSDICVFYYNKDYKPTRRFASKKDVMDYQPNSGTHIAYEYAKRKKKQIINVFE